MTVSISGDHTEVGNFLKEHQKKNIHRFHEQFDATQHHEFKTGVSGPK